MTAGQPLFLGGYAHDLRRATFESDLNLVWDTTGELVAAAHRENSPFLGVALSWAEWRALGQDRHSVVADPGFADLAGRDFTLRPDSPALALGFRPIDLARVGPRPPDAREREAVVIDKPRWEPPSTAAASTRPRTFPPASRSILRRSVPTAGRPRRASEGDMNGERRPNLLYILSDQHSPYVAGCYGDPLVRTPHLDALAARGSSSTAPTAPRRCASRRACRC